MSSRKIITIHSYRGGTGKSNIVANLAVYSAMKGKRVAVMDTDLQSPGIHVLFGMNRDHIHTTLVDFLWGKCTLEETAYDVTGRIPVEMKGKCWLVPASLNTETISRIIEEGYDVNRLNSHFEQLIDHFQLDYLLIDTHPGLNKETLLTTAISDVLVILIRPDQQDYYGSAVLAEVANKLEIPEVYIVCNKIFTSLNVEHLQQQLQKTFGYEVIGSIPLSEDIAKLESRSLLIVEDPHHPISHQIKAISDRLLLSG